MLNKFAIVVIVVLLGSAYAKSAFKTNTEAILELDESNTRKLLECLDRNGALKQLEGSNLDELDPKKLMEEISTCLEDIPKLRPIVLLMNIVEYSAGRKSMCGIQDPENSTDIEINKIGEIINETFMNTKMEFCKLTSEKVLPAICEVVMLIPQTFVELIFQWARGHPKQFTCKGDDFVDINSSAYTTKFDISKDKLLTKELPCASVKPLSVSVGRKPIKERIINALGSDVAKLVAKRLRR